MSETVYCAPLIASASEVLKRPEGKVISNQDAVSTLQALVARLEVGQVPLELRGPLFEKANPDQVERIKQFRETQYRERVSYLLTPEQLELEQRLALDERSAHFGAIRGTQVVGCVRITPAPFEFQTLSSSLSEMSPQFQGYAEFSRLVVAPEERAAYVTTRLLVASCVWAMTEGYSGILGLCRRASRTVFERYGLTAASEAQHLIPIRGTQQYTLMVGNWPQLITGTTRLSERLNRLRASNSPEAHTPMNEVESRHE